MDLPLETHCQHSLEAIQHSKDNPNNNKSRPLLSLSSPLTFQHSKERESNLAVILEVLRQEHLLLPQINPLVQINHQWLADQHWLEQMENSDNLNNKLK
jgi:hypothetical protein